MDASPTSIQIRTLSNSDLDNALELCRQNGWNQVKSDWERLLTLHPNGCFAALLGDRVIGTVTTTRYQHHLAWIGMMLVDERFRRRGIARELMTRSLTTLQENHVRSIKLDATPLGQHVYQELGFQSEWTFSRWQRPARQDSGDEPTTTHTLSSTQYDLDQEAFGVERVELLNMLSDASDCYVRAEAFGMLRPGGLADYLGPVVSRNEQDAEHIIRSLCQRSPNTVFWDVPTPNQMAIKLARQLGFEPMRELTRMWLGSNFDAGNPRLQYAIAGPATG